MIAFLLLLNDVQAQNVVSERLYTQVERMPQCPDCASSTGNMYKVDPCTRTAMQSWWLSKMEYPVEALNDKEEGIVTFQVVIDTFGLICEIRMQDTHNKALANEANRLMSLYESDGIAWTPGTQRGKKTKVIMDLSIEFSIKNWKTELERRAKQMEAMRQDSILKANPPIDSTRKVNKK